MANVVEILIKARDDASRVLQQVSNSATVMGAVAGATAAITNRLTVALEQMVRSIADAPFALAETVEQLDRLASRTGASSEKLQVMRKVIEEGGGNAEALTTALTFLNRAIANQNPLLAQLGITTTDAFAAMMQLGRAFSNSTDTAKKNAIAFALLGRGGGELIADLNSLVSTFDETNERMRRSGSLITDEMVPAAQALDKQMDELGDNWEGTWRRMQSAMVGPANAMLATLNAIFDAMREVDLGDTGGGRRATDITPIPGGPKASFGTRDRDIQQGIVDLSKIETGEKKEESPRAKRLKELMRILKQTAGEAELTLRALEAVEDLQKAQQIRDALRSDTDIAARTDTSSDAQLRERARKQLPVPDLLKVADLQLDALTKVRAEWRKFAEEIVSDAGVLASSLNALHGGLQAGFSSVFANLLTEGQTFKSAFLTIISSLVEAALQELARIAAAKAFLAILGVATGGAGSAAGGVVLSGFSINSAGRAPQRSSQTVININALDTKTGFEALVTPFGSQRNAIARAAEAFS